MKDYLNAEEKNQLLVMVTLTDMLAGRRQMTSGQEFQVRHIAEQWGSRNNLTKDEQRSLKMASTYMEKFVKSVLERLNDKEKMSIIKRIEKFDFRLVDDYTLKKIYRDVTDCMKVAAVPRQQFEDWCSEIMQVKCKGCKEHWESCQLCKIFNNNFVPESTWNLENCKYAYE